MYNIVAEIKKRGKIMTKKYVISYDIGTTGVKTCLFSLLIITRVVANNLYLGISLAEC